MYERYFSKTFIESLKAARVSAMGNILSDISFDDVQTTYPTTNTELHQYYLATVLQGSIEVTYADATKKQLIRFRRV